MTAERSANPLTPLRPLEALDPGIAVERDDQPVALGARRRQQRDMAGMDDIEAAIGEADDEPPAFPAPHQGLHLGGAVVLGVVPFLVAHVARQFEHQFVEFDGRGAELRNDDAGGGIGQTHRLGHRVAAGAG